MRFSPIQASTARAFTAPLCSIVSPPKPSVYTVVESPQGVRFLMIDGYIATSEWLGAHYMQWMGRLPMLLLNDLIVGGHDIGRSAADLEADLVGMADESRGGGTWMPGATPAVSTDGRDVTEQDGVWRWSADGKGLGSENRQNPLECVRASVVVARIRPALIPTRV